MPTGTAEPARRRGRWRAFPYTAEERSAADDAAFWGALCDEWEAHDARGRTVVGFHFYMMQADALPGGEYGGVRKRLIRRFACAERASVDSSSSATGRSREVVLWFWEAAPCDRTA